MIIAMALWLAACVAIGLTTGHWQPLIGPGICFALTGVLIWDSDR